jgi:hypothetical protein
MERQRVRGPAFHTQTVSHECLQIVAPFVLCHFPRLCHLGVQSPCFHSVSFIAAEKLPKGAQLDSDVKFGAAEGRIFLTGQRSEVTLLSTLSH